MSMLISVIQGVFVGALAGLAGAPWWGSALCSAFVFGLTVAFSEVVS